MTKLIFFLQVLLALTFAWGGVTMILCWRSLRKLGLTGEERLLLLSNSRPADPDKLRAWVLGWHFVIAELIAVLCFIAIPIATMLSQR
jgi:hypothetical protein